MQGLTTREWYFHSSPAIISLLFALVTWFGRTDLMRTRARYTYGAAMLLYVVLMSIEGFTDTRIPPALRVIRFLCLALLVIAVIVTWPRKKT
jgi:hypothetical protein